MGLVYRTLGEYDQAAAMHGEALAIRRKLFGNEHLKVATSLSCLADVFRSKGKPVEAEAMNREALGVARLLSDWVWAECGSKSRTQNPGPEMAARAREAENLLRESIAIRLRLPIANHWRTDEIRSRLGAAVLAVAVTDPALSSEARHAKLREAETLLQESNKALQPSDTVPKHYKRDSFTRLVRLYEAWEKPDKAAEWRKKVEDFDKAK